MTQIAEPQLSLFDYLLDEGDVSNEDIVLPAEDNTPEGLQALLAANARFCSTIRFRGLASAVSAPEVLRKGGSIMVRRHELTDEHFAMLEPYLPPSGTVGHPWDDHRRILNGIFWKLHTGAQWRDVPERYGPWSTVYDRHRRWCQDGTWDRILTALQVPLDEHGQIDWDQWWIDSTSIRASRAAAGARKKGGPRPSRLTMPWAAPKAALAPSCTS